MKRFISLVLAITLAAGTLALSGTNAVKNLVGDVQVDVQDRNPWTHLKLNNQPEVFHFAVVSDRTGGHRARIFSQAVEQINLLQPAFVVSVGDLIEGYTKDKNRLASEWREFQTYVHRLQMPFFYVPGNHDVTNSVQTTLWEERFGRRYYHFLYKDVLFLALCSDDPNEETARGNISKEQIDYFARVLKENAGVRWTLVFIHKPIWVNDDLDKNGWLELEKLLGDRQYTVFAGHVHRYQKFIRNGRNYYQLATTGGGSKLRGIEYGEFDHIAWITMQKDGPVLANILLNGIYPENMKPYVSDEEGVTYYNRKPPVPVQGKVLLDGAPVPGALVEFHVVDEKTKKSTRLADALVEGDGSFVLSSYKAGDGVPAGEYTVTVARRIPRFDPQGKPGPNQLPEKYSKTTTTDLKVQVKAGDTNQVELKLSR